MDTRFLSKEILVAIPWAKQRRRRGGKTKLSPAFRPMGLEGWEGSYCVGGMCAPIAAHKTQNRRNAATITMGIALPAF
jgi:hypothetical protein